MRPRPGAGGLTVDCPAEQQAGWAPSDWRPSGSDTSIQLAAVALVYHGSTFMALLEFLDGWDACKVEPWGWCTPAAPGAPSAAPAPARAGEAPPLPYSPEPVAEMVLQSFSANGTPVLGLLSLEGSTLALHCPGLAVQLPYEHNAQFDIVRMGGKGRSHRGSPTPPAATPPHAKPGEPAAAAAAAEDAAVPLRYALTVTVQNMQLSLAGEDASGCLQVRGGAGGGLEARQLL